MYQLTIITNKCDSLEHAQHSQHNSDNYFHIDYIDADVADIRNSSDLVEAKRCRNNSTSILRNISTLVNQPSMLHTYLLPLFTVKCQSMDEND